MGCRGTAGLLENVDIAIADRLFQVCAIGDYCNCKSTAGALVAVAAKNTSQSICISPDAILEEGQRSYSSARTICIGTDTVTACTTAQPFCIGGSCVAAQTKAFVTTTEKGRYDALDTDLTATKAILKLLGEGKFTAPDVTVLKAVAGYTGATTSWGAGHSHAASPASPSHHHPFAAVSMAALLSA